MDDKTIVRKGRIKFLQAALALLGVFAAEIVSAVVVALLDISFESLHADIIIEFMGSAACVLAVIALGGRKLCSISRDDIVYTFRFGWWCIAISAGLMLLETAWYIVDGTAITSDWLPRLIEITLVCLGIGIFEEFMFRGIVLNGLLAIMGSTHKGVVRAVLITSLLFGCAHIDFAADFVDLPSATQALLKIVQTGMYSFLLCVIALRTKRLAGVSLFHGFDDYLLLVPGIAFYGESLETEYVSQGEDAAFSIAYYLFVIALYVPFCVKSARELRRGQDVTRGAFMEDVEAMASAGLSAPVAPGVPVTTAVGMPAEAVSGVPAPVTASMPATPLSGPVPVVPEPMPPAPMQAGEATTEVQPVGYAPAQEALPQEALPQPATLPTSGGSTPSIPRQSQVPGRPSGLPPVPKGL